MLTFGEIVDSYVGSRERFSATNASALLLSPWTGSR